MLDATLPTHEMSDATAYQNAIGDRPTLVEPPTTEMIGSTAFVSIADVNLNGEPQQDEPMSDLGRTLHLPLSYSDTHPTTSLTIFHELGISPSTRRRPMTPMLPPPGISQLVHSPISGGDSDTLLPVTESEVSTNTTARLDIEPISLLNDAPHSPDRQVDLGDADNGISAVTASGVESDANVETAPLIPSQPDDMDIDEEDPSGSDTSYIHGEFFGPISPIELTTVSSVADHEASQDPDGLAPAPCPATNDDQVLDVGSTPKPCITLNPDGVFAKDQIMPWTFHVVHAEKNRMIIMNIVVSTPHIKPGGLVS